MKYITLIFICLGFAFAASCGNKQTSFSSQSDTITSTESIDDEMKAFRRQTFESFINLDESKAKEQEKIYLEMLEQCGAVNEDNVSWYRNNIAHIDSLSRYCIELSDIGKNKELLDVLESEIANFQSHPNATTEVCFDLNLVLTKLYIDQRDIHPDYLSKCIDLWELNRMQIEAVQSNWPEYHPLYIQVLQILSSLYKEADNPQKAAEYDTLIEEITSMEHN